MTALARGNPADGHPISPETDAAEAPIFGLQVQLGLDGHVRHQRRAHKGAVQVGYSDDLLQDLPSPAAPPPAAVSSNAGQLNFGEWQEEEEVYCETAEEDCFCWQVMPPGLMYKAYLAGEKESRMQAVWMSSSDRPGLIWECTLGGHVGLLRYGTTEAVNPQGWQLDLEGAAMPRVDVATESELEACDYRAGFLSTWRYGVNAYKAGYYHLSSHAGDEFIIRRPAFQRLNYVRDSLIVGWTRDLTRDLQIYGEVGYALSHEDGAEPLELQYGIQYTPLIFGLRGAPFAAINGHTRQDFGYITSVNFCTGWQWRGYSNHLWRFGLQYYTGPALQWEFAGQNETLFGGGMWMDF